MTKAASSWRAMAQRRWGKDAAWISGGGPVALLAPCRVLTVTLWDTREAAQQQKDIIDRLACGGLCTSWRHRIVDLRDGTT